MAKWSFLHLLRTHGHKSPSGLSLTKVAGREMPAWGNALVHSRSEQKTMVRVQGDGHPGPTSATELPHHQQDTYQAFAFIFCPCSLYFHMYFDWTYLKVCSHSAWGLQPCTMQTIKTDSKSFFEKNNLQTWVEIKPTAKS